MFGLSAEFAQTQVATERERGVHPVNGVHSEARPASSALKVVSKTIDAPYALGNRGLCRRRQSAQPPSSAGRTGGIAAASRALLLGYSGAGRDAWFTRAELARLSQHFSDPRVEGLNRTAPEAVIHEAELLLPYLTHAVTKRSFHRQLRMQPAEWR